MNCDTCGISSAPHNPSSNTPVSSSTPTTQPSDSPSPSPTLPPSSSSASNGAPYRGRRWMLRRASSRTKPDSSAASSSTSSSPPAPVVDHDGRKIVNSSTVPVDVDVEFGGILSEIADGHCEFGGDTSCPTISLTPSNQTNLDQVHTITDNLPIAVNIDDTQDNPDPQSHSNSHQEQDLPNIDVDVDMDAQSMVVSVAHSETASTISRAAFSISDRADNDAREHVALLIDSQPSRDDDEQPIDIIEKPSLPTTNVKRKVQAAYFRELMLSSLSS